MIKRAKRPGGGYTVVQNVVARDERLSDRARGLLLRMLSYPDDWNFDSKRLAEGAREGRDAIRSALTELESAGYLVRRRVQIDGRFDWDLTIYDTPRVSPGQSMDGFSGHGEADAATMAGKQGPENPAMVRPGETPGHTMAGKSGPGMAASNKDLSQSPVTKEQTPPLAPRASPPAEPLPGLPEPETELAPKTKTAPRRVAVDPADPAFAEFWQTYPRREGLADACRAWPKALTKATPQQIIAGARRYADDPNREAAFTAHPTTWLNGARWLDEPLPERVVAASTSSAVAPRRALDIAAQRRARRTAPEEITSGRR